jgi:hypothetical protein
MTNEINHLGIGAVVSFQAKFIHPHALRDERFPDLHAGGTGGTGHRRPPPRLSDAVVVRREMKKINHEKTMCVVVQHEDFKKDEEGESGDGRSGAYHELWCAESHVKVQKGADPDKRFGPYPKEVGEADDEVDNCDADMERDVEMALAQPDGALTMKSMGRPSNFDDPLRPPEGRDLMWANVNMTLVGKGDKKDRKILDGVWGDVPRKQVTGNAALVIMIVTEFYTDQLLPCD